MLRRDGQNEEVIDEDLAGAPRAGITILPEEIAANAAAADFCAPRDGLHSFLLRKKPYYYEKDVVAFAKLHQRHPGLIVGADAEADGPLGLPHAPPRQNTAIRAALGDGRWMGADHSCVVVKNPEVGPISARMLRSASSSSGLLLPACLGGQFRDFRPLLRCQPVRPGRTALEATRPLWARRSGVLGCARRDVDDELAQLIWIARPLLSRQSRHDLIVTHPGGRAAACTSGMFSSCGLLSAAPTASRPAPARGRSSRSSGGPRRPCCGPARSAGSRRRPAPPRRRRPQGPTWAAWPP